MWVDDGLVQAAAQLIIAGIDELPVDEVIAWRDFCDEDAEVFKALLDELSWADLCVALRSAAQRLPEPTDDDEDDPPGGEA